MIGLLLGILNQSRVEPLWPVEVSPFMWYDADVTNLETVSQWDDISGNERTMSLDNFSGTTSDGWNESPNFLQFDGVDSRARYDADDHSMSNLNPASTDCSFIVAIKSNTTENGWHYNLSSYSSEQGLGLYFDSEGSPKCYDVYSYDVSGTSVHRYLYEYDFTTWHIIGVTYSQATKVTTIYVDGNYVTELAAHTTGLMEIKRHSMGENYWGRC